MNRAELDTLRGKWLNEYGVYRDTIVGYKRELNAVARMDNFAKMSTIVTEIAILSTKASAILHCVQELSEILDKEEGENNNGNKGNNGLREIKECASETESTQITI